MTETRIPLGQKVHVSDGEFGTSTNIVADAKSVAIEFIVVQQNEAPETEYLVPFSKIKTSDEHGITLDASKGEVMGMRVFKEKHFIATTRLNTGPANFAGEAGQLLVMPFAEVRTEHRMVEEKNIAPGDLTIHRGDLVHASDGEAGTVDEFIVDEAGNISHIVMRENNFLAREKEYAIPIKSVDRTQEDIVYLTITKEEIMALPVVQVHRWWE